MRANVTMRLFAGKEAGANAGLLSRSVFSKQPVSEQEQDDKSERQRQPRVRLHQHPEMNHARDRSEINETMQSSPAFAAKSLHHLVCRRDRQRQHEEKRSHAREDERTFRDVLSDTQQVEETIEPNVSEQVKRTVEECKQAEHSSHLHQRIDAKYFSQRCDGNCEAEKDQRQHSRRLSREVERIWTHLFAVKIQQEQRERHERINEAHYFEEAHVC